MNLISTRSFLFLFILCAAQLLHSQDRGFDSFISRISDEYKIDLALAPELIPTLDSIRNVGPPINNIEDLLHQLLKGKNISYQIVDGNKLMLRRETGYEEGTGLELLKGTVIEGENKSPLPFAAVSLVATSRGTFTDENGYFELAIDDTLGSVQISYLGFKTVTLEISKFRNEVQTVSMEVNNVPLKEVIIIVPFQQMSVDQENQSIDLKGYQFISEDQLLSRTPEQLINNLTGYTHYSSEQGIRIRGSEEENSLILMDELPVYDPYHFYNIFSAFNGHYFSSVKLYKNNMPVEYGGRVDGLISIDSDHDDYGSSLILDTDLLMSSLTGDWAITKKIRLTAGGRISHTAMLNEDLADSTVSNFSMPGKFRDDNEWTSTQRPTFDFYDINAGLRAGIGKKSEGMISYFKNQDHLDNIIGTDFEISLPGNESITVAQEITSKDKWANEGLAIDFKAPVFVKSDLNFNGYISSFDKSSTYESYSEQHDPHMDHTDINSGLQENHLQTAGVKTFISGNETNRGYKFGVDFQYYEIDLLAKENNSPYIIETQEEYESTLFGEYRFPSFKDVSVTLGGRMTYLNSTSSLYPLPQIQVNYFIDDHWQLKSSFSKNIQTVQELSIENRFGRELDFLALSQPEAGYPVLKSDKYMVGADFIAKNLSIDAELYYKKTGGIMNVRALRPDPSFHDQTNPGEFYNLFISEGWTAGMDLLCVYRLNHFESSLSYTLSKISQQSDMLFNGNSFSPKEDRRHQVKWSALYKIGKFTPTILLNYKSKAPYLSLVRLEGRDGIGMVDQGNVFRYLPPYFSLDLGLDYSFKCFKQPAQVGVSLINLTNHENINDLQHLGRVSKDGGPKGLFLTNETELLGRTFNVYFRYLLN